MRKRIFTSLIALMFISTLSISQIAFDNKLDDSVKPYESETVDLKDGKSVTLHIINAPPERPAGVAANIVTLPESNEAAGTATLSVPAFNWFMGCSATSGSMIAGYYDRNGYSNMYTGPANGGVMPMNNSTTWWPTWSDGHDVYGQNPLAASHKGLDGRGSRGSIDNYWIQYGSTSPDPYITNGWTQHTWGGAIGDYMKTSQSAYSNSDGATRFYTWISSPDQLTCSDMEWYDLDSDDGTYGRKLFYEARGYTVTDCYNQKTDNNSGGFSFAQFQAEINAGRPVMLNLAGHTIVGVGYDTTGNTVYIHDTWDYLTHSMTWGGGLDRLFRYGAVKRLHR
jgi:hypothetical protein